MERTPFVAKSLQSKFLKYKVQFSNYNIYPPLLYFSGNRISHASTRLLPGTLAKYFSYQRLIFLCCPFHFRTRHVYFEIWNWRPGETEKNISQTLRNIEKLFLKTMFVWFRHPRYFHVLKTFRRSNVGLCFWTSSKTFQCLQTLILLFCSFRRSFCFFVVAKRCFYGVKTFYCHIFERKCVLLVVSCYFIITDTLTLSREEQ